MLPVSPGDVPEPPGGVVVPGAAVPAWAITGWSAAPLPAWAPTDAVASEYAINSVVIMVVLLLPGNLRAASGPTNALTQQPGVAPKLSGGGAPASGSTPASPAIWNLHRVHARVDVVAGV